MSYLLDTNIVSEVRKPRPDPSVVAWIGATRPDRLSISAMVVGELRRGAALIRRRDPVQAEALDAWVDQTVRSFADRILPVTAEVADVWGRLHAVRPLAVPDSLMAATAIVHGLTLVTRNVKDFDGLDLPLVDPFTS
ncbi:type II toxin-antitoxin system VapC family toxin [Kineosporia sp. A_224]|jgi:toxin FitB|uniref:type II toxin-antitoxin system VapC family toxin n=1 Tax=Kineosporia sp. A_224 TaxID=1962180 RepID=UPI000B4BC2E8|nr:type II toxin-antitoxin system VapC family toxin [Kineosporia sp. A_224]